jgi:ribulose-phosphate 3-epimerase
VPKIRQVREAYGDDIDVEVDGGVNAENVGELVGQGANIIVAGEAIFGTDDPGRAIGELRRRGQAAYDAMRLQNAKKPEA